MAGVSPCPRPTRRSSRLIPWVLARASADRHKVAEDLGPLLKEFGKISAPRVAGNVVFYELQVAGADVPYWQSLPNRGIDSRMIYGVNFSGAGPGIVALEFTKADEW
jgi:hypothetical protein